MSVPAGRHTVIWFPWQFRAVLGRRTPLWATLASCVTGCSSGRGHSYSFTSCTEYGCFPHFLNCLFYFSPFEMLVIFLKLPYLLHLAKESPISHRSALFYGLWREMLCERLLVFCHISALIWTRTCCFFTLQLPWLLLRCGSKLLTGGLDGSGWKCGLRQVPSRGFGALIWEVFHRLAAAAGLADDVYGRIRWQTCQKSGQKNGCFVLGRVFWRFAEKKKKWNTKLLVKTVTF